jgi:hypothetical protein
MAGNLSTQDQSTRPGISAQKWKRLLLRGLTVLSRKKTLPKKESSLVSAESNYFVLGFHL